MEKAIIKLLDYDLKEKMESGGSDNKKTSSVLEKASDKISGKSSSENKDSDDGKILQIALAPGSLKISGAGEEKEQKRDMQPKNKESEQDKMSMEETPARNSSLSFDFWVDGSKRIEPSKINSFTPLNIPQFNELQEGYKDVDISTMVEGFKQLAKVPKMSHIAFCWGNLYYEGIVQSVTAEYTMFAKSGNPVRAKISLRMRLTKM